MQFGLYLRSFMSDPTRPLYQQIDEVVEICHAARDAGFAAVTVPQHWVSHPTVWPQPFPMLARLAPETGDMRLVVGILLLPLHNPLDVAESVATLDHISHGRFVLGLGLGYRETELEAAGATRKDRVPRMRESLEIMKRLWSGEDVDFEGRYWQVHGARMGFTPVQKPHPPIWMASQSEGAARRAAQLVDGLYLAPQVGFSDLKPLIDAYLKERSPEDRGTVALTRCVSFSTNREKAVEEARERAASSARMYSSWEMQEETMVKIHISSATEMTDWAVAGSPADCRDLYGKLRGEMGVDYVGVTFMNLPKGVDACKDYLQKYGEEVIRPLSPVIARSPMDSAGSPQAPEGRPKQSGVGPRTE